MTDLERAKASLAGHTIALCKGEEVITSDLRGISPMLAFIKENNLDIQLDYGAFPDRPYDSPCTYGDDSKIKCILSHLNER